MIQILDVSIPCCQSPVIPFSLTFLLSWQLAHGCENDTIFFPDANA